jgi:hypothetical protein
MHFEAFLETTVNLRPWKLTQLDGRAKSIVATGETDVLLGPSVIAIAEAVSMLDAPLDSIRVLNVGTIDQLTDHPKRRDRGRILNWAKPIAPLILTASSRRGQDIAEHLIGKSAHTRFDALVPSGLYALDSADPSDDAGLAASVSRELSPVCTERFADHDAAEYTPLIGDRHRGDPTSTSTTEVSDEAH